MTQATQLDEINEDDMVAALSDINSSQISSAEVKEDDVVKMNLDSTNTSSIIELLKQIIDGKTLEISIKVKS